MKIHKDKSLSPRLRHYRDKHLRNALVRKTGKLRAARGKCIVSIRRATFDQLKEILLDRIGSPDMPAESSVPNLVSALGSFISDYGFSWSDRIGELLRGNFKTARDEYAQRMLERGYRKSYVKNRKALLNTWHRLVLVLDYEGCSVTGDFNPLQQALLKVIGPDRSLSAVARKIGISPSALHDWAKRGRIPQARHYDSISRLEILYDLEPDSLLSLIPQYRKKKERRPRPLVRHREKLREWTEQRYKLKPAAIPEDHVLRKEWHAFVRHKVAGKCSAAASLRGGSVLSRALQSSGRKAWSTRPLREHWNCDAKRATKWTEIIDGQWVPTANRAFNALGAFFGWSMIDAEEDGAGYSLEDLTLGLLTDSKLLLSFLQWRAERSERVNGDQLYFVDMVLSMLHPEDGFLHKSTEIGAQLGFGADSWRERCCATHEWLTKEFRPFLVEALQKVGRSRNPSSPIAHILDLERPIDAIVRMLNKMEADRPTTGGEHEVAWARDMALIALMTSNPLRIINFINMTYRPDNTGDLHQTVNGEWRIFIKKDRLKNTRTSSSLGHYDQAVDPAVVPYVVRYLRTYRPMIGGARPELVFVSTDNPDREFDGLDKRVRERTRAYLEGVDGIGPHAFRHIVGTHLIKMTNGNVTLAAMALHDSPKTVEKSYKHLLPSYVDSGRFGAFGASLKDLKGCGSRRQIAREGPSRSIGGGTASTYSEIASLD